MIDIESGKRRIVVVGDGQMAARCAKLVAEHDDLALSVLIHHGSEKQQSSHIGKVSKKLGVRQLSVKNVNDRDAVEALVEARPDIIFSINNWDIIRAELLTIASDGIVNFHNGPLPEYRGVNVPSWAIINGERNHGVTWHFVSQGIDAGDVVASTSFPLRADETAISLTLRCIEAGVDLFPSLLNRYVSGNLEARPQRGEGRYFSLEDSPGEGYLNFDQPFDRLSAVVRGLTFRPFQNPFTYAKICAGDRTLLVSDVSYVGDRSDSRHWTCGQVRKVEDGGIIINAQDCEVRVSGLMDQNLADISAGGTIESLGFTVGAVLQPRH